MNNNEDAMLNKLSCRNAEIKILIEENGSNLKRFITRISFQNAEYIEEIYQEVWLTVVEGYDKVDKQRPILPYLYGIAKNKLRNRIRRERIREAVSIEVIGDHTYVSQEKLSLGVEDQYHFYGEELVTVCMKGLTHTEKQTFVDWYLHKLSHEEIAKKRNISIASSKMQKYRLTKKLIENIQRYYFV